jgi:hypothetical protein
VSDSGKENGLYWEVKQGNQPARPGRLLAQAAAEGYDTSAKRTPYHGYYYRMLPNSAGFGMLAYPRNIAPADDDWLNLPKDLSKRDRRRYSTERYKRDDTWKRVATH